MERTRQPIPEGLADMPPGPGLAAVLKSIDLSRLGGSDCVEVMLAQHRQANHEQARFMAAMVEVARCGIGPDDELPRRDAPDEFAADEIRGALAWTRRAADTQLALAWDLIGRLPDVFAALDTGRLDVPKARVLSEWTQGLTDEQAREICDRLLPEAPRLTTGELIGRVKRLAIAIDPDWARRRYEEAVRDRKVVGYRNEDGSANLCGYNLPAERTAAACAHIDELAKKIKQAGDRRPIDHIRADLYLGMLDGSYVGWAETDIITYMLAAAAGTKAANSRADADNTGTAHEDDGAAWDEDGGSAEDGAHGGRPGSGSGERPGGDPSSPIPDRRDDDRESDGEADSDRGGRLGRGPGSGGQVIEGPWPPPRPSEPSGAPPARRAGVEIRAEVTTLLGLDDHPAEIAGWGHAHADLARRLVRDQTDAEWRYALTGDDGRLLFEGSTTRHRPVGYPTRGDAPARGGIVELQIPLSTLRRLAARHEQLGGWATVIADLDHQADQHEQQSPGRGVQIVPPGIRPRAGRDGEQGGRSPGRVLRRRTQIRDRTCTHPGCRMPASGTDGDHTRDWADGGPTTDENIGSLCRHDHRLKHAGGWQVSQPVPGHFLWTSRLGRHYHVRPPLIIQPLPDPIPRHPSPLPHTAPRDDPDPDDLDDDDAPTWQEPPALERVPEHVREPLPESGPADEIPPF